MDTKVVVSEVTALGGKRSELSFGMLCQALSQTVFEVCIVILSVNML